jgi:5-methylcytosine-specific restriction endonuclease McrA
MVDIIVCRDLNGIEYFRGLNGIYYKLPSHNSKINLKYPSHRALRELIFARDNYTCQMCGSTILSALQLDHKFPYSKGGKHYPENLQALCSTCNCLVKNNRLVGDYD